MAGQTMIGQGPEAIPCARGRGFNTARPTSGVNIPILSGPLVSGGPFASSCVFFFQAEDGIRYVAVTGVQTCALPISGRARHCVRPCCSAFVAIPLGNRAARSDGLAQVLTTARLVSAVGCRLLILSDEIRDRKSVV